MAVSGVHVLIFPYPAPGHTIPLLHFAHHLGARGLTLTILVTPQNLPLLRPILHRHPTSASALVLPFPSHPKIPPGVENTADLPAGGFRHMTRALAGLHDPLLRWFRDHPSPPVAIISDMFLGWTQHLAAQLGVRRYVFSPSGAFAISIIWSLWRDMPRRINGDDENEKVNFPDIPNSPIYPWWQLSPIYRSYIEGDPDSEFTRDSFLANMASCGVVINTFSGLEGEYLDCLAKQLGHDRVWATGPILLPDDIGPIEMDGSSNSFLARKISSWLDSCQDQTVVYVCFGSLAVLTNKQMEELALGLEKSGVKFILVIKTKIKGHVDGDDHGEIPEGFEDRVVGKGLVIKEWAPQASILKHKAICAFLSHCGWNSTLESLMAGVPMLAWAMGADQFVNATLLVDQLNVGIRICEGRETVLHSDDLARVLREDATSEKWRERRGRAMALSKAAFDAIGEGGSSINSLNGFVSHLSE